MAEPQTMVVPGEGGPVLSYPLPANVLQYVESVVAVIDNSSGGVATPVLSIATAGGTPIADKEQGRSIPAGDSGRATWAHRLVDEQPPAVPSAYIFDREITLRFGVDFDFDGIAQDARHLVLEGYVIADQILVQLNGDTGLHYNTLTDTMDDDNGVLTTTNAATGITNRIEFAGHGGEHKFTLTIPYYRYRPATFNKRREVFGDVAVYGLTPFPVHEFFTSIRGVGFWYGSGSGGSANEAQAINRVRITSGSPLTGKVSLYRMT